MADQTFTAAAVRGRERSSSVHSRVAALCAVALVSISGSLLMAMSNAGGVGVPFSVSWMFGPPGAISVR